MTTWNEERNDRLTITLNDRARCGTTSADVPSHAGGQQLDALGNHRWNLWADVYLHRVDRKTFDELVAYRERLGHVDENLRQLWERAEAVLENHRLTPCGEPARTTCGESSRTTDPES